MSAILRGMTWSHPRGYDPMVACSAIFAERTGVEIRWDKRSLQDFESFAVDELARAYDLIVIDHPHVGQITGENCLLPLDVEGREAERAALEAGSVGPSFGSYLWNGRQWAFPIDAATQVQAFRPDRLAEAPRRLGEVLALAREGRVALPLRPPHSLMAFMTLSAHLGAPCAVKPGPFVAGGTGREAWGLMRELAAHIDPGDFRHDPIAVFERMAEADGAIDCVPYIYGYVPYASEEFRAQRIAFADIPAVSEAGPVGSALGGTGIAVSAHTGHPRAAVDFAYFVASGAVQRGPYAAAGGQPGHADAWDDETVNAPVFGFYRNTRRTLEGSYLRPRHDGYMAFQAAAAARISAGLEAGEEAGPVLADLDRLFSESFRQKHPGRSAGKGRRAT